MNELTSLAEIVKSPEATRTIVTLLGYQFLSPIAKEGGTGLGLILKDNLEQVRQVILRKRKEHDHETNLRVAMEGFRSAAFADSKIAAEYFGGILASSGASKDDSLMAFLALVKDLSSRQLHLHYIIYRKLHDLVLATPEWYEKNLGLQKDVQSLKVVFLSLELESLGVTPAEDGAMLHQSGLIASYQYDKEDLEDKSYLPFTEVVPTTLGFQMYAVVHNEYESWRNLKSLSLDPFPEIKLPKIYFKTREELVSFATKK